MAEKAEMGEALRAENVDLGVLDSTLSFFIRSINVAVTRDLNDRLGGLDLARGTGKITTLLLVENHPGIRPSVIADVIFKDRSAMGRILEDMTEAGLIRREVAESDQRAQALFLTDKGAELAITVRDIVRQSRAFFAGVDDADYAEVLRLLRKIYWRVVASKGIAA
ncbi:MarR family transcriptional regulator [Aureimonas sp. SA4125]|uniref:MarR family winged helix-turn-helix transcriptional regulator n=1 Tax=Aureimonas sp. SA4125 TaxID=2826993 RepID=UPI001CC357B4|nr:MarR family winged helix-turn-helix transcriptional regulator [Aureimonas sp. SA4125]BDA86569.1 MarR family transcriptional regulator [Aureimonas sp. SA4125]